MAYSAAVLSNCGNYQSFGDFKFVPEFPKEEFEAVIHRSQAYKSYKQILDHIWSSISYEVYATKDPYSHLDFIDKSGLSSFYSP